MHEKNKNKIRRRVLAFCSALLLLGGSSALAAEPTGQGTARMLIPVGHTVGIKVYARGVLVVGLPDGATPARQGGLETGDVILECCGTAVTSSEQFQTMLQSSGGRAVELQIRRNSACRTIEVTPAENEQGVYAIGAWIRDSMAGIGTITYYDPETGQFGALGHGINDVDTAQLIPFSTGTILPSTVKAVKKGTCGSAGQLKGDFELSAELGTLYANTACGIFGRTNALAASGEAIPTASADEIRTGPAVIRCNVAGDDVREYRVEIKKLFENASDPRDMLLEVTDPELLSLTGGIVQGMSGSPILQNGRIVGAVTHVLINDPTRGYGIFIENMLEAAK